MKSKSKEAGRKEKNGNATSAIRNSKTHANNDFTSN